MESKIYAVTCQNCNTGRVYKKYIKAYCNDYAEMYIEAMSCRMVKAIESQVIQERNIPAGTLILESTQLFQ